MSVPNRIATTPVDSASLGHEIRYIFNQERSRDGPGNKDCAVGDERRPISENSGRGELSDNKQDRNANSGSRYDNHDDLKIGWDMEFFQGMDGEEENNETGDDLEYAHP